MAQIPQGRLVNGPFKPICRDCAIYFSLTVLLSQRDSLFRARKLDQAIQSKLQSACEGTARRESSAMEVFFVRENLVLIERYCMLIDYKEDA